MDSILIHSNAKQTGSFNILIQSSDLIDQRDIFLFQCNSPTLWSTYWKDYAQFYIKYQTVEICHIGANWAYKHNDLFCIACITGVIYSSAGDMLSMKYE